MKQRVITAVLAGAVALAAILAPTPIPLHFLAILAFVVGVYELATLLREEIGYVLLFAAIGLVPLASGRLTTVPTALILLPISLIGMVAMVVFARGNKRTWPLIGLWLSSGLASAAWLHDKTAGPEWGSSLVLLALLPLWAGDSLAYFVGRAIGKHPLAPTISPKKTWEGAIANFAGCLLGAWGIAYAIGAPIIAGLAVGLTLGVLGQAGDLLESWLKRSTGEKDSGGILPGHGGILDRLDSFLATAPVNAVLLAILAPDMFHVKPLG